MDTGSDVRQSAKPIAAKGSWIRSVVRVGIVDIAMPLAAYNLLRSAGLSTVSALVLSGVFPALSVTFGAVRHRRLEVVGALVLAGIVVGAVLGLVFHSARLLLVEGSVPTAVFGVGCLVSLRARPLMFSFALEFIGPDSAKGQEMSELWQYDGYRHVWRIITAAWGAAFLIEAALRVVIIYTVSAGTALAISKFTPFLFVGIMSVWTVAYGSYRKRKSEGLTAVTGEGSAGAAGPGSPQSRR
jgi:intracellular septation protein A